MNDSFILTEIYHLSFFVLLETRNLTGHICLVNLKWRRLSRPHRKGKGKRQPLGYEISFSIPKADTIRTAKICPFGRKLFRPDLGLGLRVRVSSGMITTFDVFINTIVLKWL